MNVVGYAYDADHHCVDCTKEYVIRKAGDPKPDDIFVNQVLEGEIEFNDSEHNPIHPLFDTDETDYPVHCSDCSTYLDTSWTSEAIDSVYEAITTYLVTGYGNTDVLDVWASEMQWAVPSQEIEIVLDLYEERRKHERSN
jgi:hypothetical protein